MEYACSLLLTPSRSIVYLEYKCRQGIGGIEPGTVGSMKAYTWWLACSLPVEHQDLENPVGILLEFLIGQV
jgi:hypothetical protein